jgi:hypothetical protein
MESTVTIPLKEYEQYVKDRITLELNKRCISFFDTKTGRQGRLYLAENESEIIDNMAFRIKGLEKSAARLIEIENAFMALKDGPVDKEDFYGIFKRAYAPKESNQDKG